jgi:hypothetical protein
MKKGILILLVVVMAIAGLFAQAIADSYLASKSGADQLAFGKINSNTIVRFGDYQTQITGTSAASDPIIGSWQSIFVGGHETGKFPEPSYDYQLTTETFKGSGVWNLTGGEATIYVTTDKPSSEADVGKAYLVAKATAATIDFNTGVVSWGTVTVTDVNNPFGGSSALSAFTQYATGLFTYTFETSKQLKNWVSNNNQGGIRYTSFETHLHTTGVPDPQTWALLIMGFALLAWRFRRRTQQAAA